jgi:hypothetical protein
VDRIFAYGRDDPQNYTKKHDVKPRIKANARFSIRLSDGSMNIDKKKWAQRIIAAIALVAILTILGLKFIGVLPAVLVCAAGAGLLIFVGIKGRQRRKTDVIFGFYVSANEILGDDEGRRYRFEITEAIKTGERLVSSMPDPPPLSSFALGALYHAIGNQNGAVQHLALAAEEELLKESPHVAPSRPLRRYVRRLRQIERRPERWAKINAAIRSLERMHKERGALLLSQNQGQLKRLVEAYEVWKVQHLEPAPTGNRISLDRPLRSIKSPRPITEVLNDVYQEERKTT